MQLDEMGRREGDCAGDLQTSLCACRYALTGAEANAILMQRLVKVDGKTRADKNYPAGLMGKCHRSAANQEQGRHNARTGRLDQQDSQTLDSWESPWR